MPGFLPVIGRTAAEAREKLDVLNRWTDIKSAMPLLEERIGHSLADYDLDGPLPDLPISDQGAAERNCSRSWRAARI